MRKEVNNNPELELLVCSQKIAMFVFPTIEMFGIDSNFIIWGLKRYFFGDKK